MPKSKCLIFIFFLTLLSCSAFQVNKPLLREDGFLVSQITNDIQKWTRQEKFNTFNEALNYALDRRLTIQRFHQLRAEPYFGTPDEKDCKTGIDVTGELKSIPNGKFFYLQVLVNDFFSMGDCLRSNNTKDAYYEFYICHDGLLIESRTFHPYNTPPPNLGEQKCELK